MMHFDHYGLLVRNAEKAAAFFDSMYGKAEWEYIDYAFPKEVLTVGEPFVIRTANAVVDGKKIEIIEPLEGECSYMMTYIKEKGEGLHHFAYRFDTEAERSAKVEELIKGGGVAVHASERRPGHRSHYIAGPDGGMVFELFV